MGTLELSLGYRVPKRLGRCGGEEKLYFLLCTEKGKKYKKRKMQACIPIQGRAKCLSHEDIYLHFSDFED
jgi:hypothetical protein